MPRPVVLALDLATVTGFAVGEIPLRPMTPVEAAAIKPPQPLSGIKRFGEPGCSDGEHAGAAEAWMDEMFRTHCPAGLIYEMPILPTAKLGRDGKMKGGTNPQTVLRLNGLAYLACLIAHRHKVAWVRVVRASQARKEFCGTGAPGKEHNKYGCVLRGWVYRDDNEADALCAWSMAPVILEAEARARARKGVAA